MSDDSKVEEGFFEQNLPPNEPLPVYETDILPVWPRVVGYFLLIIVSLAAGFMASSLLTTRYLLDRLDLEPKGQIISLASPEEVQAMAESHRAGQSSQTGVYLLHLTLEQKVEDNTPPMVVNFNTIVETGLVKDNHDQCYLLITDLAFQGYALEDQIEDPGLHSDIYGMIKVPCRSER